MRMRVCVCVRSRMRARVCVCERVGLRAQTHLAATARRALGAHALGRVADGLGLVRAADLRARGEAHEQERLRQRVRMRARVRVCVRTCVCVCVCVP